MLPSPPFCSVSHSWVFCLCKPPDLCMWRPFNDKPFDSREEQDVRVFDLSSSSATYMIGLCTGMLPAAAVGAASSTDQLLRLAPEIVRLSLRLGLEATHRSAQIERSSESWATLVPSISAHEQQASLNEFHRQHVSLNYPFGFSSFLNLVNSKSR